MTNVLWSICAKYLIFSFPIDLTVMFSKKAIVFITHYYFWWFFPQTSENVFKEKRGNRRLYMEVWEYRKVIAVSLKKKGNENVTGIYTAQQEIPPLYNLSSPARWSCLTSIFFNLRKFPAVRLVFYYFMIRFFSLSFALPVLEGRSFPGKNHLEAMRITFDLLKDFRLAFLF